MPTMYRIANDRDRVFVRATWASSYKNAHHAGMIASEDWPTIMHAQIDKILDRPGTRTIVAYEPPGGFLYGFICGDVTHAMPIVYYTYVKQPYRAQEENGVWVGPRHARGLFAALGVDPLRPFVYTCKTACVAFMHDKIPFARYVPAAARYSNWHEERARDEHRR